MFFPLGLVLKKAGDARRRRAREIRFLERQRVLVTVCEGEGRGEEPRRGPNVWDFRRGVILLGEKGFSSFSNAR